MKKSTYFSTGTCIFTWFGCRWCCFHINRILPRQFFQRSKRLGFCIVPLILPAKMHLHIQCPCNQNIPQKHHRYPVTQRAGTWNWGFSEGTKTLVSGANVKFQGGYKNPAYEIYAPYCQHKGGKHVRKICGFPKPFRPKFSLATEI